MSRAAARVEAALDSLEAELERLEEERASSPPRRRTSPRPEQPRDSDPHAGESLTLGE